jgi:hypothetical protein
MPNEDLVKAEAQGSRERNRDLEERIQDAKDATLRLWERSRHLQERVGSVESRLRFVTWLALAFLAGGVGTFALIAKAQISPMQGHITALQATLSSLQERVDGFDRAVKTGEERSKSVEAAREARIRQAEADLAESVKKLAPEILTAVLKGAVHVDPAGQVGVGTPNPAAKLHVVGDLLGAAKGAAGKALRVAVGRMDPATTSWVQYSDGGIYVDVDTSSAGFSSTPYYFTSLGGHTNNWLAQGVTSIYRPTARGFRIHIGHRDLTAAQAQEWGWYINWIAVGD